MPMIDVYAQRARSPLTGRTWVLLTEAPEGGWGLGGHAHTNAELITAARAQMKSLSGAFNAQQHDDAEQ
jgi:phenylpyruvate tautomerase PptA (4-oxalocrotonate tautomerase family)